MKIKMPDIKLGTKVFGAVALAGVALFNLASCSQETLTPGVETPSGPLEKDATYYLSFRIGGGNGLGTRADYEDGTGRESVINLMKLVFYDASGRVVGETVSNEEGAYVMIRPMATDWVTENAGGTVERYYKEVVELNLLRGQSLPAYVMCFVNPTEKAVGKWSLQELEEQIIDSYSSECEASADRGIEKGEVFAMSNSVYYDDDPFTSTELALVRAVPIPSDALKRTASEARESGVPVVDIYVERRATKLTVNQIATATNEFNDTQLGFTFSFEPEKWVVNCYERNSYLTKNFRDTDDPVTGVGFGTTNYTWTSLVERMGRNDATNWQWNDQDNKRSYWSFSPGYYATKFPLVSDDIKDKTASPAIDHTNDNEFLTGYYSFNEIVGAGGQETKGHNLNSTTYHLENTLGVYAIENASNILAAIPSVVLVGKNNMKIGETEIKIAGKTPTFYKKATGLYFKDEDINDLKALVTNEADKGKFKGIMESMVTGLSLLYYKDGDNYESVSKFSYDDLKSLFEIEHPAKNIRGDVAVPERNVTLQLKDTEALTWDANGRLYARGNKMIYVRNGQNIQPVTRDHYDEINRELVSRAGYVETYTDGMAFYNVPIKHLGWYSGLNGSKDVEDLSVFDWDSLKVGWFGLVRNHAYTMDLQNITRLGTGILDPDQPIVPDKQKETYFINYTINVLQWRVVPTQRPVL